ncbi:MAG: ATP-binding protein [Desulfobacteraceae bacterium]|nr:ATP-binding protein [Desulfobacteraceae bacterium]
MEDYKPHIGKNVLETLTLGMYEDARCIYREYVQNAADQIDVAVEKKILDNKREGRINIVIDKDKKMICIEDNATGIKSDAVLQFLGDIANSQKDGTKRKGFRGIGRLGGLGYCEKLIFETSYKGEITKSIITLNASQLKRIIGDKAYTDDAATVMSVITTLKKAEEKIDAHYFKVQLNNVTNEDLLKETNVKHYLSMVAPVPFSKNFLFREKIHSHFNKKNIKIDEYDVQLSINNEKLYKAYKNEIFSKIGSKPIKIKDIGFFELNNEEYDIIAVGWYGISDRLNFKIHNSDIEKVLRLRKDNIGIGSETTLSRFFGETRQNLNYIGELYAVSTSFIPNARRDYFNDNKTRQRFEQELKAFLPTLSGYTTKSSELHNRLEDISAYKEKLKSFNEKVENKKFTKIEIKHHKKKLEESKDQAIFSKNVILKIKQKSSSDNTLKIIYDNIIGDMDIRIHSDVDSKEVTNGGTYPITLSQLTDNGKTLIKEIFLIIEQNLSLEKAEMLKKKIAERYN